MDKLREEFEARFCTPLDTERNGVGLYCDPDIQAKWVGWQARQPEIDALKVTTAELSKLKAENEKLRMDAERYRFLRREDKDKYEAAFWSIVIRNCAIDKLDEQIDNAMKESSK